MVILSKFKLWVSGVFAKFRGSGFYKWVCYRLNIRRAIVLAVLLNLVTVVNHTWFDLVMNGALCLVGFFDYKDYFADKKFKK